MSHIATMNRRVFLKGAGVTIALPFLESVGLPAGPQHPTRVCFFYVPNGMSMPNWRPPQVGALVPGRLPPILRPLADHLDYITVTSGLDNRASERTGRPETQGQHARSIAAFLSAVYPTSDLRAGQTIDVVLAQHLDAGRQRGPLNLTTEYAHDQHDVGYSEVFNYSLSWKDERTSIAPIDSPRLALEALCEDAALTPGEREVGIEKRRASRKSILDAVLWAGRSLRATLSSSDRQAVDEYLESLRGVERRIDALTQAPAACADVARFAREPSSFDERLTILLDILHLALQSDSRPVATLLFGAERSERDFGFLSERVGFDMSGGHHSTSHHKNQAGQIRKYVQICAYHTRHLARFLEKLKNTKEGDGNLLDHTFIVYGASMADGNSHEHYDLPLLIAGKGNGLIDPGKQGFHIDYGGKPLSNLYMTLLQKLSVADSNGSLYRAFGDSGGALNLPVPYHSI